MKRHKANKAIDTRRWFDRWSNEYDRTLGSTGFHRSLLDLMIKNAKLKAGDKVLDIGCGTGLLSLKFLRKIDCYVTGIDCSGQMISIFRDKVKKLGLGKRASVCSMDAESLKFEDNTFDRVVSSAVLHHLKDKLAALRKIFRVLRPGGIFMIGEIDMDSTGKHTDIDRLKRILRVLEEEWVSALQDVGVEAFARMYDNGKKHILNLGEYCISLKKWAEICREAGFSKVTIKRVPRYKSFGVVIAEKPQT